MISRAQRADTGGQHPGGLLGTHVSLARHGEQRAGAMVPSNAAQGYDAEGFDMGMAIDGASHHDSQGAVFGSEGSMTENGVHDERGTRVNQPAGLTMKAAGQTQHQSSTLTADNGERAVYVTFPEPVSTESRLGASMPELLEARESPRQGRERSPS